MDRSYDMTVQVLVTTMNAEDFSKVEQMNLRNVDVILANQTDHCAYEQKDFTERAVHAVLVSTNTTGASLNRNIAMAHATADIVIYADDDMKFRDDAFDAVIREFEAHPEADVIKFGCESTNPARPLPYKSPAVFTKACIRNIMSSGVPAMAFRRERFRKYDISFPDSIGPGRTYNCGEDSWFIRQLLRSPLRVFLSPVSVALVEQNGSTWFTGYDEDFFITQGYVYAKNYGRLTCPLLLRRALKLSKEQGNSYSVRKMLQLMQTGVSRYRKG